METPDQGSFIVQNFDCPGVDPDSFLFFLAVVYLLVCFNTELSFCELLTNRLCT